MTLIMQQAQGKNSNVNTAYNIINFTDFEKAFESMDREMLWKPIRHYRLSKKLISLIQCTYQGMTCRFSSCRPDIRQLISIIHWIMKTATTGRNNEIQWTL